MKIYLRLLMGLTVASAWGCASGGPSGTPDDAGVASDAAPAPIDAFTGEGFGEQCEFHTDCEDALCYRPNLSDPTGTCSKECEGTCPDGFACTLVPIATGTDARVCIPAEETMCKQCSANADCGDSGDFCVQFTAGTFCTVDCQPDPTVCPDGFTCQQVTGTGDTIVGMQCMPTNGTCCIDKDGDTRGEGDGCITSDCDDDNDKIYDDASEVCDGFDNNCVGGIDIDVTDCKVAECQLGGGGYFERSAEPCEGGSCTAQSVVQCNKYTCKDGGETGDTCATACESAPGIDDDARCITTAHCDGGACEDDFPDGNACNEPSDCQSGHCNNGFCCSFGECCSVASNCPTFGTVAPVCDNQPTCQGTRGEAVCGTNFVCSTTGTTQDDSACGPTDEANDCGFYNSVFCDGDVAQSGPACPTTCASDADCDDNAYCDDTSACVEDNNDGRSCNDTDGQGDAECSSDHCQNGFCCTGTGADCCAAESDCPASYTGTPACDTLSACRGTQDLAACNSNVCVTITNERNDEACTPASGVAKPCGYYKDLFCAGGTVQPDPVCPTSCATDAQCDDNGYCNSAGECVADQPDGGVCNNTDGQGAAECQAGRCNNGYCCSGGSCCANDTDCAAFDSAPNCTDQAGCQGSRNDGVCSGSKQCVSTAVADDSACSGVEANACGLYPSVFCTADASQTPAACASSCDGNQDCDASAHCDASKVCVPNTGPGGACTDTNDCGSGLTCTDNVCCTTTCGAACERCDASGDGTCTASSAGTDPDNECNAVDCSGYYDGWVTDTCYRKADVSESAATCDGNRACRTQAVECGLAGRGSAAVTCDSLCQDPNGGTCGGTSAGVCTNVTPTPADTTCGSGPCEVTEARCVNGVPNTCTPDSTQESDESCNDIDDNCDGSVDNGLSGDWAEPNSQAAPRTITTAGSQAGVDNWLYSETLTLYSDGDVDYYKATLTETDNSCGCGLSFFEDYRAWVGLKVPQNAGSYEVCMGFTDTTTFSNCTTVQAGGATTTWIYVDLYGGCPDNDEYTLYMRVSPIGTPGYECSPYRLDYQFESGYCF